LLSPIVYIMTELGMCKSKTGYINLLCRKKIDLKIDLKENTHYFI
jgi:hypothetical protein